MSIQSVNPATGALLKQFHSLGADEIEQKLRFASQAFRSWKKTPFAARAELLNKTAAILDADKQRLGEMATTEMGKTLVSAIAEVEKCALGCRYYAENGERFLQRVEVLTNASRSYLMYQPIGPVLAVMPWNFPFWQVYRFAAPALMAGNVGLLKHASNVPQCALGIEEVFLRAGFPEGVFQTLLIESGEVERVLRSDHIAAVTLTGSEAAGRSVAQIAGSEIKKTVLELGGSDPFVVMSSAANSATVTAAVKARCINNGQSCIAAKRFIVEDSAYDEFERKFVEGMRRLRIGDPKDPETEVGPLATENILASLQKQIEKAVSAGARVLTGGKKLARPGNYFEPTVLAEIPRGSEISYEEFFGPVALLFRAKDIDEAIDLANDSRFGLGASVWTGDAAEQQRFAEEIETGQVFINSTVASDPRLPFGGVKRSGYGRELSEWGIREFVNVKTVWIK